MKQWNRGATKLSAATRGDETLVWFLASNRGTMMRSGHARLATFIRPTVVVLLAASGWLLAGCSSSNSTETTAPSASTRPTTLHYYAVLTALNFYGPNGEPTNST